VVVDSLETPSRETTGGYARSVKLDAKTGTLYYRDWPGDMKSLAPRVDGRPALLGGRLLEVWPADDVLAVLVGKSAVPGLYFVSASRAAVIGILPSGGEWLRTSLVLSRDGRRFARRLTTGQLEVRDVPGDRPPVFVTSQVEKSWIHFALLAGSCLLVRELDADRRGCLRARTYIRWAEAALEVIHRPGDGGLEDIYFPRSAALSHSIPPTLVYPGFDFRRFVQIVEHKGLRILIDRYNHLAVFDRRGSLVSIFFVSRDEFAAWMPDGTVWGSRRLIGCEPAADAAERIAAALRAAQNGEGGSP
jgi:hypothetical protein